MALYGWSRGACACYPHTHSNNLVHVDTCVFLLLLLQSCFFASSLTVTVLFYSAALSKRPISAPPIVHVPGSYRLLQHHNGFSISTCNSTLIKHLRHQHTIPLTHTKQPPTALRCLSPSAKSLAASTPDFPHPRAKTSSHSHNVAGYMRPLTTTTPITSLTSSTSALRPRYPGETTAVSPAIPHRHHLATS
jgi:hypothetical protein